MEIKHSNFEGTVSLSDGTQVYLRRGMTADAEHQVVKERPELFDDAPAAPELSVTRAPETYIGRQAPEEVVEVDGAVRDVPEQEEEAHVSPRPIERATARPGERSPARDVNKEAAQNASTEPTPQTKAVESGAEAVVKAEPASSGNTAPARKSTPAKATGSKADTDK